MKKSHRSALMTCLILLSSSIAVGCSPVQVQSPSKDFEPTCIQGTVLYRTPANSTPVPYPYAGVNAWRHGTGQGLAETKTDGAGNYCIEVPLGDFTVDLRVWGVNRVGGTSYTCKGSQNDIDPGTIRKECGEDCVRIDIVTDCDEFRPPYRRQM